MSKIVCGMRVIGETHAKYQTLGTILLDLIWGRKWGFPGGSDGKESACSTGDLGFITWRREWQLTPVFLPGEFHGQRSLAGYSPRGRKELDTTEVTEHAYAFLMSISPLDCKGQCCAHYFNYNTWYLETT